MGEDKFVKVPHCAYYYNFSQMIHKESGLGMPNRKKSEFIIY